MTVHTSPTSPLRVGIVGSGRVGSALAGALRDAGVEVEGPLGRGERPVGCDAILLCVPDAEIPAAAEVVTAAAPLVGHTSGATPLSALAHAGIAAFGLHPLQTVAHLGVRFEGVGAAVAGTTPEALAFATDLAERLGMTPFEIDDSGRAAYHAAASVASNFLVTLQAAAETIAGGAGLDPERARALLAPLVRQTVENIAQLGPEAALTGPVARGDAATVAAQRAAVEGAAPELVELFDELVRRTRELAGRQTGAVAGRQTGALAAQEAGS
jgi:predicted short-subunit dehydrogenase-like oxidoreductase (DUF2520 family)